MKNVLNIILTILSLPVFIVLSPILWYRFITRKNIELYWFLTFGRTVIGGYSWGKLKVGTNKNNVIYQNENFNLFRTSFFGKDIDNENRNITTLLKMKVYNYWVEDDYLFVKVYTNDRLIKKYQKEVE